MQSLIAGLLAVAIVVPAAFADRQQQTDQLIQNLTNYAQSPSSVSGAQAAVNQSDNFANGVAVTNGPNINPGGAGGGLLGQQAGGQLGGAADPSANPQTLKLVNGITSQIQGSLPATTSAQTTTQGNNNSKPVQTQLPGVNYQNSGIFYEGATTTPKKSGGFQQRALPGSTGGQYQTGP